MVKAKYQSVLDLGEKLKIQKGDVQVNGNRLEIKGVANNQYQKDLLWDEIKRVGGENPDDITADIKVADTSVYARHTVEKGESLSKISKHYYGDPMKYNAIFEANRDQLDNPDMIHPGQQLVIPKL
ncbi:MAG: LysM peptidoglycan-binding domain-containing protein [Flavobacteriales bacterium]|jgi:nucleoid-associated protein YgaU|uniref:LysM peptidoglycan-binding domain-containing protein n=1 Tax=Candidatus Ulvibacter alkanivorans TaxID=2267620 RepID=UPI000DF2C78E|nr:LysM peptidoglycan-binding domain-containing protein [Candidatus Ulvibacter alkanivorans]MCH2488787.1 LysM peptidoglycan-binding domain-containing protein [Flavobacteriales bacterium]